MQLKQLKIAEFWLASVLLLVFIFWTPLSFAQSAVGLHSSQPAVPPEEPRTVEIGVQIDQISEINQKAENFQVVGSLRLEWDEPKLVFDSAEHGRNYKTYTIESFTNFVDQQGIVAAGFYMQNQQGRRFTQGAQIIVLDDGHVIYLERFTVTLQAPYFDFTQYPFDSQKFFLHVDSVAPLDIVRFKLLEEFSQLGDHLGEEEWAFERNWTTIDEVTGITGKSTSRFTFGFEASRHLNYYFFRIFLPLLIILLVSWFTFFLNDYGKRVDMAVTNLLVFVAFNFTISNDLPRLGYLTFIDAIMFVTFVLSGVVVFMNVIFRRMEVHGRESLARRIDNYTIWIYPLTLVALVIACWIWYVAT